MANIHQVIDEVGKLNPELARQIQKYVKTHSYGLVFEENLPDAVRLYTKKPAVGDTVNILPERGKNETDENKVLWVVKSIGEDGAVITHDEETKTVPVEDIVPLVGYKDVIYPGLKVIDKVERGDPDDPYHMVINSENYHALEALTYAYAGKVDCIYIDPPYNKEDSKDWKYNCNYVDRNDQYRHSKWLSFMERRLKLAKQLLNPNDSVMIITIDEVEYNRLGLLLEKLFPEAKIEMVSDVINPRGATRDGQFSRSDEYLYIVQLGKNSVFYPKGSDKHYVEWYRLRRTDYESRRGTTKGGTQQFYPIYVDVESEKIVHIGEPLLPTEDRNSVPQIDGAIAVFPIKNDGTEMNWGVTPDTLKRLMSHHFVRVRKNSSDKFQPYLLHYISYKMIDAISEGKASIEGYNDDGTAIVVEEEGHIIRPGTAWNIPTHNGGTYGSEILAAIIGEKRFTFPKSIYSVADVLRYFVSGKPDALIIDFFAGSGTTLNAVNLLNAEDEGKRRCICVTNNEVSEKEVKTFVKQGLRQGDPEWEKYGIANYVTWPRTKCCILGKTVKGDDIDGKYLSSDMPMSDGFKANAIFCELTYESAWPIRLDNAFDAIAPILWMQAGCRGPIIKRIGKSYLTTDYYGVLFDYNQASKFCEKVKATPSITTVYVVTDDQRRYSNICKRLAGTGIDVHRLYETYLRTFEICGEGGLD